jgi:L-fuconolactonase
MSFAFVDAHVHFWDPPRLAYPWLADVPAIAGVHTPADLSRESAAAGPAEMVFVQADCTDGLAEVEWIEQLAAAEPRITALVAHAPMAAGPATTRAIATLRRHPLVRGVRHLIQGETDPRFCLRPEFVAGVRQLGSAGLTFDLCCRHHQLAAVTELVRLCPQTTFILDHAGKPGIRTHQLDPWRADIATLATLPNVVGKLSGLVTEADPAHWTPGDLQPYVAQLLATFGAGRLLFGSDWPVVKLAGGYARWLDTVRRLLGHLPAAAQSAIFSANARRLYRLHDSVPS